MKRYIIAGLFILSAAITSQAQEMEYTTPVKMNDKINSTYEESNPLLSPDGKVLYFVRTGDPKNSGGDTGGQDVWYSTFENGRWTAAKNDLEAINNGDNNAVVGVANEGEKLFLINNYSAHPRRDHGVVFTAKSEGEWIAPRELDIILKMKSDFYGFYMTPEEDVLLISMESKGTIGGEDLYVSFRNQDSTWTEPIHMGETINSEGYEISPFLSADKKTLYFASNGFGGEGNTDIFKTERLDESWERWSTPENLGGKINSTGFDAYFSVYEDKAFFVSNREGVGSDIYAIGIEEREIKEEAPKEEKTEEETEEPVAKEIKEVKEEEVQPAETKEPLEMTYIVYFDFDQADLSKESVDVLAEALETIHSNDIQKIVVTGHADSQGPESYNQQLSKKRAAAVADYLKGKGVTSTEVKAAGETKPIASNDNIEQRKENRRVEILVKE